MDDVAPPARTRRSSLQRRTEGECTRSQASSAATAPAEHRMPRAPTVHFAHHPGLGAETPMGEVSLLLLAAREGDRAAADEAFALVYADLQRLARRQVRQHQGGPGATSMVHEVYLRLVRPDAMQLDSREHFFALAARAMRQLVIDHARQRAAAKRGGGIVLQDLDEIAERIGARGDAERLIGLDQALNRLAALDRALVTLVEMRFFAGLELDEIAGITGRSERSLKRDWRKARAVLHAALGDGGLDE